MKNKIDTLINNVCHNVSGGELVQLGALFSDTFLIQLSSIIYSQKLNKPTTFSVTVDTKLCWIDKAPYAQLSNNGQPKPFSNKVELGDAMFIINESFINNGIINPSLITDKAFILQAKVTKNKTKACYVPITTNTGKNSTYKELELYKNWLPFDIYYSTRGSAKDKNISLPTPAEKYAWYGVVQHEQNHSNSNWPCRWMIGKSRDGTPCNKTLGHLLSSFYEGKTIDGIEVGDHFSGAKVNPEWKKVVDHVINCSKELKMPKYVLSKKSITGRVLQTQNTFYLFDDPVFNRVLGESGKKMFFMFLRKFPSLIGYPTLKKEMRRYLMNNALNANELDISRMANIFTHVLHYRDGINFNKIGNYKPGAFPIVYISVTNHNIDDFEKDEIEHYND
ncbi:hypothetical protein LZP96_10665 [Enterobacteriaceae bacterium 155047]|uniref:hypothetical protein n=1 Tax=Huaxiibacter chinensis TaxID=2899785 RepID=UPI002164E6FA|nr:hypothetical protein [Huaxiibacter chinensis]MCG5044497.1 hypothetical protein [Huaxiibacter chinensis]